MNRTRNDLTLCLTYLRHEVRHRWWQSLATAAGLGVGVAVVITVTAVAAGADAAESRVLQSLDHTSTSGAAASQVGAAVVTASGIAADLTIWVAVATLAASCAVAVLLTLASVARRGREFGTLKAVGWSARRITAQVLTETTLVGIAGTAAGVAFGCGAAALISALGPTLTVSAAKLPDPTAPPNAAPGSPGHDGPFLVHYSTMVSPGVLALAVALGILGTLVAGALSGWRAARLRPATALAEAG